MSPTLFLLCRRAFIDISVDDKGKAIGLNQVEWKGSELEVGEDAKRSQQAGASLDYEICNV